MLVWRGAGIIVPILVFICAMCYTWISGDPDGTLGNINTWKWATLISSPLLLLIGLGLFAPSEDEQGNKVRKKHDFFWIPVFVWGIILGGICIYTWFFAGKSEAKPTPSEESNPVVDGNDVEKENAVAKRVVHFYNPSDKDSMGYLASDNTETETNEEGMLAPLQSMSLELPSGNSYLFGGFNAQGNIVLSLPADKQDVDTSLYVVVEGKEGNFYQRILRKATPEEDDNDDAWLVLDGKTKMLLVNVSTACADGVSKDAILKAKWSNSIQEEYEATDLIEPLYKMYQKDKMIRVFGPGDDLPTNAKESDLIYLLVPYRGEKDKNALIAKTIVAQRF